MPPVPPAVSPPPASDVPSQHFGSPPPKETAPFYQKIEFYIHLVWQVLIWIQALPIGDHTPPWVRTAISAASLIGYVVSEGVSRSAVPYFGNRPGVG